MKEKLSASTKRITDAIKDSQRKTKSINVDQYLTSQICNTKTKTNEKKVSSMIQSKEKNHSHCLQSLRLNFSIVKSTDSSSIKTFAFLSLCSFLKVLTSRLHSMSFLSIRTGDMIGQD